MDKNINKGPFVSVIMPVYNTEKYLQQAIDSILSQTFTNFEFIIIDDASTDQSVAIIKAIKDSRIKLIVKPQNTGYTASLNMGLNLSKGKYVARMDSDDIAALNRFEEQIKFMESNPEIDVCGTWFTIIGSEKIIKHPKNHDDIKLGLLSYCTIGHPTVIIRTKTIKENNLYYDKNFEPAEDYNLWSKISMIGRLHNLENSLLSYRIHDNQVSSLFKQKQSLISDKIKINMLNQLLETNLIDFNLFDLEKDKINELKLSDSLIIRFNYIEKLILSNNKNKIFNQELFNTFMNSLKKNLFTKFFHSQNSYNLKDFLSCLILSYNNRSFIKPKIFFKYFVKSLIKYQ